MVVGGHLRAWWVDAHRAAGWFESNVFRMDKYPYKDGTQLRLLTTHQDRLEAIYRSFDGESKRLERNGGQVIVPQVQIRTPSGTWAFQNVVVTPHDVRLSLLSCCGSSSPMGIARPACCG